MNHKSSKPTTKQMWQESWSKIKNDFKQSNQKTENSLTPLEKEIGLTFAPLILVFVLPVFYVIVGAVIHLIFNLSHTSDIVLGGIFLALYYFNWASFLQKKFKWSFTKTNIILIIFLLVVALISYF